MGNFSFKRLCAGAVCMGLVFGVGGGIPVSARAATFAYEPLIFKADDLNGNTVFGLNEDYNINLSTSVLDGGAGFYADSEARNTGTRIFYNVEDNYDSSIKPSAIVVPPKGFPLDGKVTVSGVPFQLACGLDEKRAYDGNDSIRLMAHGTGTSDDFKDYIEHSVRLDTIGVYDKLYILATAGGPGEKNHVDLNITLEYTDGTKTTEPFDVYDWFDVSTTNVDRCDQFARVSRQSEWSTDVWLEKWHNNSNNYPPFLYSLSVEADETKLLESVTFEMVGMSDGDLYGSRGGLYCGIYAITGSVDQDAPAAPTATDATGIDSTSFMANWNGIFNTTKGYRLDVSTDPEFKTFLPGYANLDVGNVTSFRVNGVDSSKICYYRVRAVNANGQSQSSNVISVGESALNPVNLAGAGDAGSLPETGDGEQPLLWLALCAVSAACLAGLRARRKA